MSVSATRIRGKKSLANWINGQNDRGPYSWSIATRSLIRVLPLIPSSIEKSKLIAQLTPTIRVLFVGQFLSAWSENEPTIRKIVDIAFTNAKYTGFVDSAFETTGADATDHFSRINGNWTKQIWRSVRLDALQLENYASPIKLFATDLWHKKPPPDFFSRWLALRSTLQRYDENWDSFIAWYDSLIDGTVLQHDPCKNLATIDSVHWETGGISLNEKISAIIKEDEQERRTPQGVDIVYKQETGKIGFRLIPLDPAAAYEAIISTIRDDLSDAKGLENQVHELVPIIRKLERAVNVYFNHPWRVHNDFSRSHKRLLQLSGSQASDIRIKDLAYDLQVAVSDLRAMHPEMQQIARARSSLRIMAPNNDVLNGLQALIDALGDAGEEELVAELQDHLKTIHEAKLREPNLTGEVEDGDLRDAAYAEGGLMIRIRNRANEVRRRVEKGTDATIAASEKAQKIQRAAEQFEKLWSKVEPWISQWF